ncbi:EAL domain-containing protein [Salinarimonas sp.]|uniref:sensor domain-containing protein n=1 Tax=Salinarimonas sp. TaxID=2766526 RepID=UPI00391DC65B
MPTTAPDGRNASRAGPCAALLRLAIACTRAQGAYLARASADGAVVIASEGIAAPAASAHLASLSPKDARRVVVTDAAGRAIGSLGIVRARAPGRAMRARLADLAQLAAPHLASPSASLEGSLPDAQTPEGRLRDFLASSSDWIWETDAEHRFTLFRDEAGVSGLAPASVIGRTRWALAGGDPSTSAFWAAHAADLEAHRPIREFVYARMRDDGRRLVSEVNGHPVFDAAGRFIGYRGTARDIAERHDAQESLKRLTLVARLTRNAVVLCDARGLIEWVNPACERLARARLADLVGRPPSAAIAALAADTPGAEEVRRALAAGTGTRARLERIDEDGHRQAIDLDVEPIRTRAGEIEGTILVGNDVTEEILGRERLQAVIDNVAAGIALRDATGTVIACNRAAEVLLGFREGDLIGHTTADLPCRLLREDGSTLPPEEHPASVSLATGESVRDVVIGIERAGTTRWMKVNARLLDEAGTADRKVITSFADVTTERRQQESLAEAHARATRALAELGAYRTALDQHSIVAVTDRRGRITYVNDLFCKISGYEREELIGNTHKIVNSGTHEPGWFKNLWRTIATGRSWRGEICNRKKSGGLYWVDTTIVPMRDAEGRIESYVSIRYDITERKRAEAAVAQEIEKRAAAETLLRDVLDTIPDAVAAYDTQDRLVLFNKAYKDFYALSAPAIEIGAPFEDILRYGLANGQYKDAGTTPEEHERWLARRLATHRQRPFQRVIQPLGDGRWLQVRERRSRSGYIVGVRTDITSLKLAEAAIKRHAEQDPLTGLANRAVITSRLRDQLESRRRADQAGAVVLLDLDHFKDVNDTLGHDAGDALLREVARRLTAAVRGTDTVARLGGDEFAVMLPGLATPEEAHAIVEGIHRSLQRETTVAGRALTPSASIGVTLYPHDGTTPTELLKNADIALYQAKARGRGIWCFFDPALRTRLERRGEIAEALRAAIATNALTVALQPQAHTRDGTHAGFEALVRWTRDGEPVSPGEFVPVAEETGLIERLGSAVIDKALASLRTMLDRGLDPGQVAVNVAAAQLKRETFVAQVEQALLRYALPPQRLEIEVTENVLLDRAGDKIAETLRGLHRLGVTIALDDFGTGYASLAHLKRFPVDRLKIDQSFVRDIGVDPEDAVIARTIVNLAHSLGMSVVAEGIETREQLEFLRLHGCDIAQGYLIGRPLSEIDAACDYLANLAAPARMARAGRRIG